MLSNGACNLSSSLGGLFYVEGKATRLNKIHINNPGNMNRQHFSHIQLYGL